MEDSSPGQVDSLSLSNSIITEPSNSTLTLTTNTTQEQENETIINEGFYKLRALNQTNNISTALDANWLQGPQLPTSLNASALSSELVNETLNYFVNCGKRLSQMTKTYDDNDAYIMLLQEKEVDLELTARIGQNLLRQNNELKESVASLKRELDERHDHVQQLKHELASKTLLLDTYREEEENQSSLEESEQLHTCNSTTPFFRPQDQSQSTRSNQQITNNNKNSSHPVVIAGHDLNYDEDHGHNRFFSLNYSSPKPSSCFAVEPFSSLPHYMTLDTPAPDSTSTSNSLRQHHHHNNPIYESNVVEDVDSNSSTVSQDEEDLNNSTCPILTGKTVAYAGNKQEPPEIIKTVTFQLVESNKRLCELQDEIFYKTEQNSMQQEKIVSLQEQLRESDRRLSDVASQNVTLLKSMDETKEIHSELTEELRICKRNFNELLRVFLAMQKESRILRNETIQKNSTLNYFGEEEVMMQDDDFTNATYDFFTPAADNTSTKPANPYHNNRNTSCEACCRDSHQCTKSTPYAVKTRTHISASPSLLEELQETLHNKEKHEKIKHFQSSDEESDNEEVYESDSGVILNNNNNSASDTPTTYALTDAETEDRIDGSKGWLGISSFVISAILLLCLSVTFRSSPNSSLPRKLHLKLD